MGTTSSMFIWQLPRENYATWSRSVEIALAAKNEIGFINGTFEPPSPITQPDEYEQWDCCNSMLRSWFVHSVSTDLASSVLFASTVKEAWDDFRDCFSQGIAPRIYQIQKAITSHVQGSLSIANYFTKLKSYWDELGCCCPPPKCQGDEAKEIMKIIEKQKEQDQLIQFLMGLNDSYNVVRGQILLMKPPPSIQEAYNLITQEEKQREIGNNSLTEKFSVAAAIQNFKHSNSSNKSYRNSSSSSSNTEGLFCNYCKKDRHTIDGCYKLHGYPPGQPRYNPNFHPKSHFGRQNNQGTNQQIGQQHQPFHAVHASTVPTATTPADNPNLQSILLDLSTEQYQQLTMAMANMAHTSKGNSENSNIYANTAGLGYGEDDWMG